MVQFVDAYRADWGVEPICREIQIAPSQYYEMKAREADASRVPNRQIEDAFLTQMIQKVYDDNFQLYGARKVWHALKRSSVSVARCTVERLMRAHGLEGVRRGKLWKTTIPDEAADRPLDLVDRQFKAVAPNRLWVADFTYGAPILGRRLEDAA